jgi:uncharacterized repeat protein (TIGR03803 family)
LYGTASQYGADFVGVVFKLSPTIGFWNYSVLHTFTGGRDGGFPYAGLTLDANGNLYGATYYGGLYQYGTIYKLSNVNGKWQETVLHSFANGTDGASPYGSVLVDSSGNVFGTAQSGGAYGYGVLYEITQQ